MQTAEHDHLSSNGDPIIFTELRCQNTHKFSQIDNKAETNQQERTAHPELVTHSDTCWDGHEYSVDISQEVTNFRTTFRVYDIDSNRQGRRELFDRLWSLQTGRRHTWEDDNKKKTIVRREAVWKHCDSVLQSCEVPSWVRRTALRKTFSNDLQCFNRYYSGTDGACIGFALNSMFEDKEEAKCSWIANRAADTIPSFDQSTVEGLIDLVFEKYD